MGLLYTGPALSLGQNISIHVGFFFVGAGIPNNLTPLLNFRPGDSENCPEWVMIELQGDLETKSQAASLSGKFIGDLHYTKKVVFITALKLSLQRLYFYRCLSVQGGGVVSQHALQQVRVGGGIPACLAGFQAHTQGEVYGDLVGGGGSPGPHPRGKLRGIWSRPTAKGEVEGDLVQANTQGGS